MNHKKKIGVDIFSGAGGLSLGAESAGLEIGLAIEKDLSASKTFSLNHPGVKMLCVDISKVDPKDHLSKNPFIILNEENKLVLFFNKYSPNSLPKTSGDFFNCFTKENSTTV